MQKIDLRFKDETHRLLSGLDPAGFQKAFEAFI